MDPATMIPPTPLKPWWRRALSAVATGFLLTKPWWRKALNAVATGFLLTFAYVLVLFGLFAGLNIVSPSLLDDQAYIVFFSIVSGIVVIAPPVLVSVFLERLRTLSDDSLKTPHTEDAVVPMIRNLRIRSRLFKLGAAAAFLLVVGATLLGFTVAQDQAADGTITGGVTALVLLLFLLRTLASIYRHNMRLASFYDSRADYLQAGGKTKDLDEKDLLGAFATDEIDLGWTERLKGAFKPRQEKSAD